MESKYSINVEGMQAGLKGGDWQRSKETRGRGELLVKVKSSPFIFSNLLGVTKRKEKKRKEKRNQPNQTSLLSVSARMSTHEQGLLQ